MEASADTARDVEVAYERHRRFRETRDWTGLASCFAEDARYFDPIFGWYEGRDAIRGFLETALAGLADRSFVDVWHIAQEDRLVVYWRCEMPGARGDDGLETLYHGMSALLYAGRRTFREQMDIYDREQARASRRRAGER